MNYFCLQLNDHDCGFACVKMLLANVSHKKEYLYLDEDLFHHDYTFKDLKEVAGNYNLEIDGYEISDVKNIKNKCIGLINVNNKNHYIYIYKITKQVVYFFDPNIGKREMNIEDFNQISSQKYLMICDQKNINKKIKKYEFYNNKYAYISLIIAFIEMVAIFIASFNLEKLNGWLILSIIMFIGCIICEKVIANFYYRKYDSIILNNVLNKCSERSDINPKFVKNEFLLKQKFFSLIKNSISNSLVIGFIAFILIVNDLRNLFFIGIIVWLIYSENNYINKTLNPIRNEIDDLEDEFNSTNLLKANTLAYDYTKKLNYIDIFNYIIIFICATFISIFNKSFINFLFLIVLYKMLLDYISLQFNSYNQKIVLDSYINIHKSLEKYLNSTNN